MTDKPHTSSELTVFGNRLPDFLSGEKPVSLSAAVPDSLTAVNAAADSRWPARIGTALLISTAASLLPAPVAHAAAETSYESVEASGAFTSLLNIPMPVGDSYGAPVASEPKQAALATAQTKPNSIFGQALDGLQSVEAAVTLPQIDMPKWLTSESPSAVPAALDTQPTSLTDTPDNTAMPSAGEVATAFSGGLGAAGGVQSVEQEPTQVDNTDRYVSSSDLRLMSSSTPLFAEAEDDGSLFGLKAHGLGGLLSGASDAIKGVGSHTADFVTDTIPNAVRPIIREVPAAAESTVITNVPVSAPSIEVLPTGIFDRTDTATSTETGTKVIATIPGTPEGAPADPRIADEAKKRAALVAWAQDQIGVQEASGNNDGDPSRLYMDGASGSWALWCDWFESTGQIAIGDPFKGPFTGLNEHGKFPLTQNNLDYFRQEAGTHVYSADEIRNGAYTPQPGDVGFSFYPRPGSSNEVNHIYIVQKYNADGTFTSIDGNWSNKVSVVNRSIHDSDFRFIVNRFADVPDAPAAPAEPTPPVVVTQDDLFNSVLNSTPLTGLQDLFPVVPETAPPVTDDATDTATAPTTPDDTTDSMFGGDDTDSASLPIDQIDTVPVDPVDLPPPPADDPGTTTPPTEDPTPPPETEPTPPPVTDPTLPAVANIVTKEVVAAMLPDASQADLDVCYPAIMHGLDEFGIATVDMALYAFATNKPENTTCEPIRENGEGGGRYITPNGNYYGRGYVQITWEDNYRAAGEALGDDLVGNPDLALQPEEAGEIMGWYLKTHQERLEAAFATHDIVELRKVVNGGTWGLDEFRESFETGNQLVNG